MRNQAFYGDTDDVFDKVDRKSIGRTTCSCASKMAMPVGSRPRSIMQVAELQIQACTTANESGRATAACASELRITQASLAPKEAVSWHSGQNAHIQHQIRHGEKLGGRCGGGGGGGDLLGVVVLVAVRAQPVAAGHAGAHLRQGIPVPHQQACAAETPTGSPAPTALRLACDQSTPCSRPEAHACEDAGYVPIHAMRGADAPRTRPPELCAIRTSSADWTIAVCLL